MRTEEKGSAKEKVESMQKKFDVSELTNQILLICYWIYPFRPL